jgi:prepilin-type N-terminal cleavage/methylation domain-containing protein
MVRHDHQGVTLIELIIALVVSAVLVAGIYSLFITQSRSYTVQDSVAGVQQDARAAMAEMGKDIRMAGFLVGAGSGTGFMVGGARAPLSLGGTNLNHAINDTNSDSASDSITVVYASRYAGRLESATGSNVLTLEGSGDDPDYDSAALSDMSTDLGGGASVYVALDLHEDTVYPVNSVDVGNRQITLTAAPTGGAVEHERVYRVESVEYRINAGALLRNNQPIAGDGTSTVAEDLQFAYQLSDDTWTWAPADETAVRAVRINLIMRTGIPDAKETSFSKPACEDRPANASNPGCRRRVYATVVHVRNLDL